MRVSKHIETLVAYKPGKPIAETKREYGIEHVVKLASNENCLGISPKVVAALTQALKEQFRYPDAACFELIQIISDKWKVPKAQLALANGSNEAIDLLVRIFCQPGDAILTTEKAFIAYQICAQAAGVERVFAPQASGYKTDLKAMARILKDDAKTQKIKLVFIPNPNNPTGTYVADSQVQEFLAEFGNDPDRLIIFDEAYTEYARASDYASAKSFLAQYSSVVVLRTLSKAYALAGLRVGVVMAPPAVIDYFNRVRNPFNINDLAQVAAIAALQDDEFLNKVIKTTWQGLDYFYEELRKMQIPFVESQGNFVMFDSLRDVTKVNEALLRKGVILRPLQNYGFKTELRMTVGTREENVAAITALKEVFSTITPLK